MKITKKENGIAAKVLVQEAMECFSAGDFVEMKKLFIMAVKIANKYDLKEKRWIAEEYNFYMNNVVENLRQTIADGENAKETLKELGLSISRL